MTEKPIFQQFADMHPSLQWVAIAVLSVLIFMFGYAFGVHQ